MTRMIVTKPCRYGTRHMTAGEEFDATGASEVKLYTALGWAKTKPPEEDETPLASEWSSDDAVKPAAKKKAAAKKTAAKRTYTRRNLSAG